MAYKLAVGEFIEFPVKLEGGRVWLDLSTLAHVAA